MQSPRHAVFLILLVALLVRVVFAAQMQAAGYLDYPIVDAETFVSKAIELAFTSWWGEPRAYYHEPLYLYVMALSFRLFGYGLYPMYALNFLCGCVTALLTFQLARQLMPGRERLALLAGLAAATCGPLLYFEGQLLREALATCLTLAAFVLFWRGRNAPTRAWALAIGLLIGLAGATRGSMLVLLPVCLFFILWRRPDNWGVGAFWLLFGATLILAPIAIRNDLMDSDPIFLASNWGLNLYLGNNAAADETLAIRPGTAWEELCAWPERASGATPGTLARQKLYVGQVETWALAHPGDFVLLQLVKLYRFLRGYELMRNIDPYFVAERVPLLDALLWRRAGLSFPTGLIIPFALVGLLAWRPRWSELAPYILFLALFTGSVVMFFVVSRYRAPLLPFLLPAALAGADALWSALRHRRWRLPLAALALVLLANYPFPIPPAASHRANCIRQEQIDYTDCYRQLGDIALRRGYPEQAADYYLRGSAMPDVLLRVAIIRHQLGDFAGAEAVYREVIDRAPENASARGKLLQLALDRAEENVLRAGVAGRRPKLADVRQALERHQPRLALDWLRSITGPEPELTLLLSEAHYQCGRFVTAEQLAATGIAGWPDDYRGWLARGWARLGREDYCDAGADLRRALALAPHDYAVQRAVLRCQAMGGIWPPLLDYEDTTLATPAGDRRPAGN